MAASGGWAARPPLLRLGFVSTAGVVVAVLCIESMWWFGSGPAVRFVAAVADVVALGVVAGYCWLTTSSHAFAGSPTPRLREVRNSLATGLGFLLAMTVADSFSGERVGLPGGLRLPVATLAVVVAAAFAWAAIVFVRLEQAVFDSGGQVATEFGAPAHATAQMPPLERMRVTHGLVGGAAAGVALTLFAAGTSPYVFAFACVVLIPSVGTWAYATLRTSRLDRRSLPETSPDRPPDTLRTVRMSTVAVLALTPVGVFWWVWLTVGTWGSSGLQSASGFNGADVVLAATVVVGLVAAAAYPFFAIAEALRTPTPEPVDDEPPAETSESVAAPLGLATLHIDGRGTGTA